MLKQNKKNVVEGKKVTFFEKPVNKMKESILQEAGLARFMQMGMGVFRVVKDIAINKYRFLEGWLANAM